MAMAHEFDRILAFKYVQFLSNTHLQERPSNRVECVYYANFGLNDKQIGFETIYGFFSLT